MRAHLRATSRAFGWILAAALAVLPSSCGEDNAAAPPTHAWGPWRDAGRTLAGDSVRFRTAPWPIPIGDPFAMDVEVGPGATADASPVVLVVADGTMPHHGHGMNFRSPRIAPLEAGGVLDAKVEGLLFHMPGKWHVTIDLQRDDGSVDRVSRVEDVQP